MFTRRETFKQYVTRYPITSLLLMLITVVMILEWFYTGFQDIAEIVYWGGMMPEAVTEHQYWRFFTYAFLHSGLSHFLFNSFSIIILAPPLEKILGKGKYILFMLVTILSTSVFVYAIGSQYGVGASGFGFGLLGLYVFIVLYHKNWLSKEANTIIYSWIAIAWISTFVLPDVSLTGHLGGFIGGIIFGFISATKRDQLHQPWS